VLTDTEERTLRTRIYLGVFSPVCVAFFIFVLKCSSTSTFTRVLWCGPVLIHIVLTCVFILQLWHYLHRLKGEKKEEFLRLYWHLHNCSKVDDILEIAITIDYMATLIGDQYSVVRDFVFQHAGMFLAGATAVPLRIPESHLLIDALRVLRADLEELPEYLSSDDYWLRDAASRRLEELQSVVH